MSGFKQFINKKLIIVDVQPSYGMSIPWIKEFGPFVSQYSDILCLYNGPELGMENKSQIAKYYYQNGMSKETIYRLKWYEKNYAFFRDLMDQCWLKSDLIKIVKYMLKKKINDIRDLTEDDVRTIGIPDLVYSQLEKYGFYLPGLKGILRSWNGADICGGGLDECLEEVLILANAMNLKFNIVQKFVY